MNEYKKALHQEMLKLAKIPNSIFLGQQVGYEDFYGTLKGICKTKRLEMPVAEELQMGMSLGMALEGYVPISIYQRMDFLPRAMDQLVNHLDILEELSQGKFKPRVIIRTTIGSTEPLDVGLQHNKDMIEGFQAMLRNIKVIPVRTPEEVHEAYKSARLGTDSVIIVEYQDLYHT